MTELLPEPRVDPIVYQVSLLPADDRESYYWSIRVESRGDNTWAVCWMSMTMTKTGRWRYEPMGSSRGAGYLKAHRHDLDTALALAKDAARKIEVNGLLVTDLPAWRAARRAEQEARDAAYRAEQEASSG